jgi:hypothetical protein
MPPIVDNVNESLDNLEVENYQYKLFIPFSSIQNLLTEGVIKHLLRDHGVQFYDQELLAAAILRNGLRLLATLVTIRQVALIKTFHAAGFSDARMPISEPDLTPLIPQKDVANQFWKIQWKFLALILEEDEPLRALHDRTILPFQDANHIHEGGFGCVKEVSVVPDQHRISGILGKVLSLSVVIHPLSFDL